MLRWFYVLAHLLAEAGAARRDARIRFLKAQVEILRRKLGGNRVIPSPDDRARLLAIGQELGHKVADVIGIVTPQKRIVVGWTSCVQGGSQSVSDVQRSAGTYASSLSAWPRRTRAGATAESSVSSGSSGCGSADPRCAGS